MKVTKFTGFDPAAVQSIINTTLSNGNLVVSTASNAYALGGIEVIGAAGSNFHLVAYSSNNARWIAHDASGGGSVSYGSNAMAVSDLNVGGSSTDVSRMDHRHQGIATVTASSSNTMQRPVLNLRPGTNISFGLTSTDGDAALDTLTINNTAAAGGGGGSGFTHTYVGYNTIGGSWESPGVNAKVYWKTFTLASDGMVVSVGAHIQIASASDASGISAAIYTDSSSAPELLVAHGEIDPGLYHLNGTTGRWMEVAVGKWLTAGTYWMCIRTTDVGGSLVLQIAYDGSGSDITATGIGSSFGDYARYTPTTTSNRYSIRASVLT